MQYKKTIIPTDNIFIEAIIIIIYLQYHYLELPQRLSHHHLSNNLLFPWNRDENYDASTTFRAKIV